MIFDIRNAGRVYPDVLQMGYRRTPSKGLAGIELSNSIDIQAESEGVFISRRFTSRTHNFGHRLKRIYKQGDDIFPTGEDHRAIARSH